MLIKIVKGNYGYNNGVSVKVKTPADAPFSVSDEEALRLEQLGVAKILQDHFYFKNIGDDEENAESAENDHKDSSDPDGDEDIFEGAAEIEPPLYSADNTNAELQAIVKEYGIDIPPRANKTQLLEILDNYFGDAPVLSAEEPQV